MNPIVDFELVEETKQKDTTGQTISTKKYTETIGKKKSVYQKEFFQAAQSGLRPECVIETSAFNYNGERLVRINGKELSIYRTFLLGTDKIDLFIGERVGNEDG